MAPDLLQYQISISGDTSCFEGSGLDVATQSISAEELVFGIGFS